MFVEQTILYYEANDGKTPFLDWLNSLKDMRARAIVRARLVRIQLGNFGDCKSIGGGVFEFRIAHGPGYRIYFGRDSNTIVILLCGGDKSSQSKDITKAKLLWKEHKNANKKFSC